MNINIPSPSLKTQHLLLKHDDKGERREYVWGAELSCQWSAVGSRAAPPPPPPLVGACQQSLSQRPGSRPPRATGNRLLVYGTRQMGASTSQTPPLRRRQRLAPAHSSARNRLPRRTHGRRRSEEVYSTIKQEQRSNTASGAGEARKRQTGETGAGRLGGRTAG